MGSTTPLRGCRSESNRERTSHAAWKSSPASRPNRGASLSRAGSRFVSPDRVILRGAIMPRPRRLAAFAELLDDERREQGAADADEGAGHGVGQPVGGEVRARYRHQEREYGSGRSPDDPPAAVRDARDDQRDGGDGGGDRAAG